MITKAFIILFALYLPVCVILIIALKLLKLGTGGLKMTEYDVTVQLQVIIEANSKEEAEDIAIKNIQNCLEPYYIEAEADEN
jgi:hypothetical protein